MHSCGYIITDKIPTNDEISDIMEPYNEETHENLKFSWDWFIIGGRYGGMLKIKFNPDENESKWFACKDRNYKYFISQKLTEIKKKFSSIEYDELDNLVYMGLNENILYVDGAYTKDILNLDITNNCFVIDSDGTLYSRDLWDGNNWITDQQYDEKVKKKDLQNKFITVIDMHY